jgi:hypothetical protein
VKLHGFEISDDYASEYSPEIEELLAAGYDALQEEAFERAERVLREAIERAPQAKEAYHNLSVVYARQEQFDKAQELLREALAIDPSYVMARCSLAIHLLVADDLEGAQATLEPLQDVTQFTPQAMAYYAYTQARMHVARGNDEAARSSLQMALEVMPGYDLALNLLDELDQTESLELAWGKMSSFWEREAERRRKKRGRLQSKLTTLSPGLEEALSLYTKNALTGTGWVVMPWGGWSALRKAELIAEICQVLTDKDMLQRVVESLEEEAQAALRDVMQAGGTMPWQTFDACYDNDLDESPYWAWHSPESVMGILREHGLLAEAEVDGELWVVVPVEVRQVLAAL